MPFSPPDHTVRLFLSYAREDVDAVSALYDQLQGLGLRPWMDKYDILAGERWQTKLSQAIRESHFFLACLSAKSVEKRGYLQREFKQALDQWQEKLDGDIYLIPVRLDDCQVPETFSAFQWVNLYEEDAWWALLRAIRAGAERQGLTLPQRLLDIPKRGRPVSVELESKKPGQSIELVPPNLLRITDPIHLDLVRVPAGEFLMGTRSGDIERLLGLYGGKREEYEWETEQFSLALPEFYIARTMVTVEQFEAFVKTTGYQTTAEKQDGGWVRSDGQWEWVLNASWREPRGSGSDTSNKLRHPVTQVSFCDGQAFCNWLKGPSNPDVQSFLDARGWDLRMPTEAEWERAARGPQGRDFPWGNEAPDGHRCNYGMRLKDTTPVDAYPNGQSKEGMFDMAGNVWEWTTTLWNDSTKDQPPYPYPYHPDQNREDPNQERPRVMRGGSFHDKPWEIRCAFRHKHDMKWSIDCGSFRVCVVKR